MPLSFFSLGYLLLGMLPNLKKKFVITVRISWRNFHFHLEVVIHWKQLLVIHWKQLLDKDMCPILSVLETYLVYTHRVPVHIASVSMSSHVHVILISTTIFPQCSPFPLTLTHFLSSFPMYSLSHERRNLMEIQLSLQRKSVPKSLTLYISLEYGSSTFVAIPIMAKEGTAL